MPARRSTPEPAHDLFVRMRRKLESAYAPSQPDASRDDALAVWRSRPLEPSYAMVFIDSLPVRVRENQLLATREIHLALGVLPDGGKDIIAFWIAGSRANVFWPSAMNELKRRSLMRVGLAIVESFDGCAEAIAAAFPDARVCPSIKCFEQHLLSFVPPPQRPEMSAALRRLLQAPDRAGADAALHRLSESPLAVRHPGSIALLRSRWRELSAYFELAPALREFVSTTTAVESLTGKLRRRGITKRSSFQDTDAAVRELLLVLQDANATWKVAPNRWVRIQAEISGSD